MPAFAGMTIIRGMYWPVQTTMSFRPKPSTLDVIPNAPIARRDLFAKILGQRFLGYRLAMTVMKKSGEPKLPKSNFFWRTLRKNDAKQKRTLGPHPNPLPEGRGLKEENQFA
jgi:hypothetical protein